MKSYIVLALCLGIAVCAHSQQQIHGLIFNDLTKEPVAGATIRVAGEKGGQVSDINGNFLLNMRYRGDTLVVSALGYLRKEVRVAGVDLQIPLHPLRTELSGLIVSASRDLQPRSEAPVAISSISTNTMRETKAATLDQLLNTVSGVYMVDLGNEQHTMAIRQPIGYRSTFLYLEDGIPIRTTGDFNHNALIEINMAALKRIEVIRGPSSSLYGSDAIGGAVNFITADPSATPALDLEAQGSSRGYRRMDFQASGTFGKTGVYLGGYYAGQRHGYMDHSDFDKTALTAKVDHSFSKKTILTWAATLVDYKTDQTGGLDSLHFYGKDYRNFYTFTYRKVNALRMRTTLEEKWNDKNHTTFTFYNRHNSIGQNPFYAIKNRPGDPLKADGEVNRDGFDSYGLLLQHSKFFNKLNAKLIGGLQLEYNPATYEAGYIEVDRDADGYYTGYQQTDSILTDYRADIYNTAAYAQLSISPLPLLTLVGALRFDRLDYHFDNHLPSSAFTGAPDANNSFDQFTPKLGATYNFGENKGVYANFSIGFAPPDINDLYRGVKVPFLKPARYHNEEIGGWWTFSHQDGYAEISFYRMMGKNEIISVHLPDNSYENANAGRTRHEGIEYTLRYRLGKDWRIRLSGTLADHRFLHYKEKGNDYSGKEMNTAPHLITNSRIIYHPHYLKGFHIGLEWERLSRYFMDPANTKYYKGYNLLNLRLGYEHAAWELWSNVLNAGDVIYATTADKTAYHDSYRPGPLRSVYLGFSYHLGSKGEGKQDK